MFADCYKIPIGNVKNLVPNFFNKEKYLLHFMKIQSSAMAKTICQI